MSGNSQKFIARNRAPRVQIEYDVELYGSEKKVQLPFVMGVMSDLAGKSKVTQPEVADRSFLEIDTDNFDDRMRAMAPRAAFAVPNTLTGEGNIEVDLTFEKMADFSPAAIAAKVEPLRPLLEARTQLSNLMAYMDGKAGAEALIEKILADPSLLTALAGAATGGATDNDAALQSLRDLAPPPEEPATNATDTVLEGLAAAAPADEPQEDRASDVLSDLAQAAPDEAPEDTSADDALAGLAAAAPEESEPADEAAAALDSLSAPDLPEPEQEDTTGEMLAGLAASAPAETAEPDDASAALDSLATADVPEAGNPDAELDDLLGDLAASAPAETDAPDEAGAALDSLAAAEVSQKDEPDVTDDLLADLAAAAPEAAEEPDTASEVLGSLAAADVPEAPVADQTDDLLADLAAAAPEEEETTDAASDALGSLAAVETEESNEPDAGLDDLLGDLAASAHDDEDTGDDAAAALDSLAATETGEPGDTDEELDDLLGDLAASAPADATAPDAADAALDSLATAETEDSGDTDAGLDDLLGDLAASAPEEEGDAEDVAGSALDSLTSVETPAEEDPGATDELLAGLAAAAPEEGDETPADTGLDDLLGDLAATASEAEEQPDTTATALEELAGAEVPEQDDQDDLDDLLAGLSDAAPAETETPDDVAAALDDLAATEPPEEPDPDTGLDDLLGDLAAEVSGEEDAPDTAAAALDSLPAIEEAAQDEPDTSLDDLLGDLENLAAEPASEDVEPTEDGDPDLDALLSDLDGEGDAGLDDLLGDLGSEDAAEDEPTPDLGEEENLDDLLAGLDGDGDLDDLLGDLEADTGDDAAGPDEAEAAQLTGEPEFAFGTMAADRPDPARLNRRRFRLAIMGDFSGRAARGQLETGDALASRRAILLDPDTAEDVIEGFATDLVLPVGKDGAGVAVSLKGLDDLHPDELYEKVGLFSELAGLRGQLASGATAENAAARLRDWGEKYGQPVAPTSSRSSGSTVPADLRLSDFQKLIGDTGGALAQASPLDEMLARIVGPHVHALPDPDAAAMTGAVDDALSAAMRLILHHPEFQSVEAQWRSVDLIARSIETDDTLDVMLYDISAEEIAADLAAADDLSQSGFVRLLTEEPLDEENGRGGYSVLIGLYTFEETPPHAELLGRIARAAAHVDAPFFAAITPTFLGTDLKDRHPLVDEAWTTLRGMPEAGHLGLVTPRFLLRRPYGAKSEPIYEFEFEEFTMADGMKGMLWANPAVLVAILLARSFKENGAHMNLGSIMSLGDMPYHYVTDRFGDQVALPCTERNMTLDKIEQAVVRGFMSVASVKGRDELRLTSFQSVAGGEILGPWSGVAPPPPSPPDPAPASEPEPEIVDTDEGTGDDTDLDDLLAGFGEDTDDGAAGESDVDAELAALLDDL